MELKPEATKSPLLLSLNGGDREQRTIPRLNLTATDQQLLMEWNQTQVDYPHTVCIPDLFEAQVERTPDAIAVSASDISQGTPSHPRSLTYRQLNQRANQLAHYLQTLGVGPETLVGVCATRSIDLVIGLLGILKAGGAYVPLDPSYPLARLSFLLEDSQVPILLTQEEWVDLLPTTWAHVFCLDSEWETIASESEENPARSTTPDNRAYVIYTSGSTGNPKGVEIEHTSVVNLATWHQRQYDVIPSDRATQLASPAFDASAWEIWTYLTAGASLHIPNEGTRKTPAKLLMWLAKEAITLCFLPTALAEAVLDQALPDNLALRVLLTGGDTFRRTPQTALPFRLVNHYGPTENTVVTTSAAIPVGESGVEVPPIGRAIANTHLYLLDSHLQPVPIGDSGELYIGGKGLARGYFNRPDLTAEKFIPHPFSDQPAARLYKTGDLARYRSDGNLEFLGRTDSQVKIRGFRIELGEIETALSQHPQVRDSVVLTSEDASGDLRLVAYLVSVPQITLDTDELRSFLKEQLPEYMVPAVFVMLETLPLTPNGKVDRRSLPEVTASRSQVAEDHVSPQTEIEQRIAAIWQEVLNLDGLSVDDNFFDLGGHSIHIGLVNGKLKDAFDRDISMVEMFQYPTIRSLGQFLSQGHQEPVSYQDVHDRAKQRKASRQRIAARSSEESRVKDTATDKSL